MSSGIVVYNSISVVNRAKKTLQKLKKDVRVIQLPSDLGIAGCSYALECRKEDLKEVLAVSEQKKLKIKAVYIAAEQNRERVYTPYDIS